MIVDWTYGAFSQNPTQYSGRWFTWSSGAGGAAPEPPSEELTAPGVGKGKRKVIRIRLSEVESRETTADFLKSQLRLRQGFPDPLTEIREKERKRVLVAQNKREAKMRAEHEKEAQEEEVRKMNNAILQMIAIAHDA